MMFRKSDTIQNSPSSELGQVSPTPYHTASVISTCTVYSEDTSSSSSSDSEYSDSSESSHLPTKKKRAPDTPASASCTMEISAVNETNSEVVNVSRETDCVSNVSGMDDLSVSQSVQVDSKTILHEKEGGIETGRDSEHGKCVVETCTDTDKPDNSKSGDTVYHENIYSKTVQGRLSEETTENKEAEGSMPFKVLADPNAAVDYVEDTVEARDMQV